MIIELLVVLVALGIVWNYFESRAPNFPPGPMAIPLLGHIPLLGRHPWRTLQRWKTTYGPVIGIWFGGYRAVVINDSKLIREALNMSAAAGRPSLQLFSSLTDDGIPRGIGTINGAPWKEQRRFMIKQFRDFGIRAETMEVKIQHEICELLKIIRAREGVPIKMNNLFNTAVVNALWSILFGDRMKEDDPESEKAFRDLTSIFSGGSLVALAGFMPWVVKFAPRLTGFKKMIEHVNSIKSFIRKQVDIHSVTYVENQPRDIVDVYRDEVEKTTDPNSSFHAKNDFMVYVLLDLFSAGTETTSTTLLWLCAYMIHYTHVQKKLQQEIDDIIGRERVPCLTDRSMMPYTEAVINEVMRFSSIFPFSVFRNTTEDVEFHGYSIPKDTMIVPNVYSVHFDETIWGDPENFRPERFMDSNVKFKKNDHLLPFSAGKRVCIGEGLAKDQLFLFTTNLFQSFSASAAGKLPSLEPHLGVIQSPQPFEMNFKLRDD